ncbi:hypothetical protein PMIN01_12779 [Paraphaeosphaeria minitans]|uniref:Uncharacterized protein n=1 Tax=Paraphaeosphaeria minitans TaxID=565426 RepID=A0A9P6G536_9PLEO|nr:hypothetical protein PMIN01_12779 [Paraphaeosphaeria minitans]
MQASHVAPYLCECRLRQVKFEAKKPVPRL